MMADTKTLQCVVVTPERTVVDEAADFVAVPLYDGELGVLPRRAPLIGKLGCGELRIRHGNESERVYVDGGFAQVRDDVVTILTARAMRASDIMPDRVQAEIEAITQQPTTTTETRVQRQQQLTKLRKQLRVAGKH
jgi:F-type H+-transporting ATPase subunit epsilon